jgi:cellulose biosynthesis protein BcsQ
VVDRFDYVLIDCPPSWRDLERLVAAQDEVIIPVQCESGAEIVGQLTQTSACAAVCSPGCVRALS